MNETEWSALLFFKSKGHPIRPESFEVELIDLWLKDIGTKAFTAFKNTPDEMMDMYEAHPEFEDCRMGIIHSHHNMDAFYSGQDMEELHRNSSAIDFYLSIVINNADKWIGKAVYQMYHPSVSWKEDGQMKTASAGDSIVFKETDMEVALPMNTELASQIFHYRKKNEEKSVKFMKDAPILTQRPNNPQHNDFKVISPADDAWDEWRSKHKLPEHISDRQVDLFESKTLKDMMEEEQGENFPSMIEIAKSCISMQPGERRAIDKVLKKIHNEIKGPDVAGYVQEVMDGIEEIYCEMTDSESLSNSSRSALLRYMLNLLPDEGKVFSALRDELQQELDLK